MYSCTAVTLLHCRHRWQEGGQVLVQLCTEKQSVGSVVIPAESLIW